MAKVTFGQSETVIDVVPTPVPGVAVETVTTIAPGPVGKDGNVGEAGVPAAPLVGEAAPFPPGSLTPVKHAAKSGGLVLGDQLPEFKDIILPRINLVQGVGNLKDSFPQGAIVYNQSVVLFVPAKIDLRTGNVEVQATPPVIITLLGVRPTRFAEKVEGGANGMIVASEEEVRANGGTTDYKEWELKAKDGMKRFEPLVEGLIAIQRPVACADDDTVFVYECEGNKYALAIWGMKGTSYTNATKRVFFTNRMTGCLRGGYPTHSFSLSTRLEKHRTKPTSYQVPVVIPRAKSTPGFLQFVASILNPPEATE